MSMDDIYSKDIEKICRLCVHSKIAKGVSDYVLCSNDNGYYKLNHTCNLFKYDILKKQVRRKKDFESKFTADDFTL